MQFRKIDDTQPVVEYLVSVLTKRLSKQQSVLWLVPGGSSIAIAATVSQQLNPELQANLYVTLTDERYGTVDHPDSNWRQLTVAGFTISAAKTFPVLTGLDRETTTAQFAQTLQELFETADFKLGFFGIGADGHTAGVLPASPAVESADYAASYDAGNFERITMTPLAISKLDEAVVYATGEAKHATLDNLEKDRPVMEQPAQALKQVNKLTIFNDYKGDTV